jgi:hypothetical protein
MLTLKEFDYLNKAIAILSILCYYNVNPRWENPIQGREA